MEYAVDMRHRNKLTTERRAAAEVQALRADAGSLYESEETVNVPQELTSPEDLVIAVVEESNPHEKTPQSSPGPKPAPVLPHGGVPPAVVIPLTSTSQDSWSRDAWQLN